MEKVVVVLENVEGFMKNLYGYRGIEVSKVNDINEIEIWIDPIKREIKDGIKKVVESIVEVSNGEGKIYFTSLGQLSFLKEAKNNYSTNIKEVLLLPRI